MLEMGAESTYIPGNFSQRIPQRFNCGQAGNVFGFGRRKIVQNLIQYKAKTHHFLVGLLVEHRRLELLTSTLPV